MVPITEPRSVIREGSLSVFTGKREQKMQQIKWLKKRETNKKIHLLLQKNVRIHGAKKTRKIENVKSQLEGVNENMTFRGKSNIGGRMKNVNFLGIIYIKESDFFGSALNQPVWSHMTSSQCRGESKYKKMAQIFA